MSASVFFPLMLGVLLLAYFAFHSIGAVLANAFDGQPVSAKEAFKAGLANAFLPVRKAAAKLRTALSGVRAKVAAFVLSAKLRINGFTSSAKSKGASAAATLSDPYVFTLILWGLLQVACLFALGANHGG